MPCRAPVDSSDSSWPLFQSLSSGQSGQLMGDYLLDCEVTCLCSYLRFLPLHYISGFSLHLSSVIIKAISARPTHVKRLTRRPTRLKTTEWTKRSQIQAKRQLALCVESPFSDRFSDSQPLHTACVTHKHENAKYSYLNSGSDMNVKQKAGKKYLFSRDSGLWGAKTTTAVSGTVWGTSYLITSDNKN